MGDDPKGRQQPSNAEERREHELDSIKHNVDELFNIVSNLTEKFEDVGLRLDQSRSEAREEAKETTGEFKAVAASAAGQAARLNRLEQEAEGPPAPPRLRRFSVTKRSSNMGEYDPTTVSLKEFLLARVEEINHKLKLYADHLQEQLILRSVMLEKQLDEKASTIEKATSLASRSMEARLEGMNEFRTQLKDQASEFVRRQEFSASLMKVDSDIRSLTRSKDLLEGKASMASVYLGYAISLIALALAIVKMFR